MPGGHIQWYHNMLDYQGRCALNEHKLPFATFPWRVKGSSNNMGLANLWRYNNKNWLSQICYVFYANFQRFDTWFHQRIIHRSPFLFLYIYIYIPNILWVSMFICMWVSLLAYYPFWLLTLFAYDSKRCLFKEIVRIRHNMWLVGCANPSLHKIIILV